MPEFPLHFRSSLPETQLVVEVDGEHHEGRRRADARGDELLARLGYRVLRLDAELVEKHLPLAVARIEQALARLASR